jgi:hypothetical protein
MPSTVCLIERYEEIFTQSSSAGEQWFTSARISVIIHYQ